MTANPEEMSSWERIWLTVGSVHDCRWSWRNLWGSIDAFYRYRQDPAAGRSPHATQIRIAIFSVCEDIQAGRSQKRTLQWRCTSFLGIFPWDHHFLRDVRIQQEAHASRRHTPFTSLPCRRYVTICCFSIQSVADWPGFIADFAASFIYVPSEVLKTRLQLQGRYNNPFFNSGYNYRSTIDAARTIIRHEGISALFYGYKATIFRDLPFSALQFAFYEQEQNWARQWAGSRDIGIGLEIATAASAGGMAGVITCPLDVVKTRIQTQINPSETAPAPTTPTVRQQKAKASPARSTGHVPQASHAPQHMQASHQRRAISTSSPNTSLRKPDAVKLDTSSVMIGLRLIYKTEGVVGLFRGVGPRFVWTSVQSGTMLVLYQALLRQMAVYPWLNNDGQEVA